MPIGNSPNSLSSHVMKIAPPFLYAFDARIFGISVDSHVSPFLIASSVGQPKESCMSLHRFGVMNAYCGAAPPARSVASWVYGTTCWMHVGLVVDGGVPAMAAKERIGVGV